MKNIVFILILLYQFQFAIGQEDAVYISDNKLYGELKYGLPEQDTIIELKQNGILVGKGAVAISEYGISNLKVGYWKEYYDNGNLKMEGDYLLGSYVGCCTGGACRFFHYYRTGLWKFYNDKGELNYELAFEPTKLQIDTTCEGGDKLLFGLIKEIPLKYLGDLTSDKIFEFQKIRTENEYSIGIWTPLNGRIFIESKRK
tara:strand:- start:52 stop:651 length:600 start_codon:yes stop_codon:yes gene_type:complete